MTSETATRRGVLIVDPQPNMANLVANMLRAIGRGEAREAYDTGQALLELRRRPFDLLILDDAVAPVDAVELVRRLRADAESPNRSIPVIMMAAAPDAARISAARDAGVTEFLRKPFAATHLKARLDTIAARPRLFIETQAYSGPDRRRRSDEIDIVDRRTS
jgi:two-component system, chemotaxis family, chemotaxis protein CheY